MLLRVVGYWVVLITRVISSQPSDCGCRGPRCLGKGGRETGMGIMGEKLIAGN